MFFDPQDYQEHDPNRAKTPREAERLRREASKRAKLCETMTQMTAQIGFEATSALQVFGAAGLGSFTFYKLFPTSAYRVSSIRADS